MKENELTTHDEQEALALRLQERALLTTAHAAAGERLVLADATLLAALAGSRVLTPNERAALAASPLTLRRLRQLSLQGRAAGRTHLTRDDLKPRLVVCERHGGVQRARNRAQCLCGRTKTH